MSGRTATGPISVDSVHTLAIQEFHIAYIVLIETVTV